MWPDVTLVLREFARRPAVDRPDLIDPGVACLKLRALPARVRAIPRAAPRSPATQDP